MLTQSPAVVQPLSQPASETKAEVDGSLSLNRIAAALQVVLATRRAARSEEHAYWYAVARGI